ncbi:BREX-1 system adenine-specific DNA-methyltransferase PglX [Enterocloster lavalensis]|nr:BREX-1 system adenine-specific DNA-methyltransferase PglX [Enterocloster lavalensis]
MTEPNTQKGREELFLSSNNSFFALQDNFIKIPGAPVAYWLNSKECSIFRFDNIMQIGIIGQGLITGDTNQFTRLWYEVDCHKIKFHSLSALEAKNRILNGFHIIKEGYYENGMVIMIM